MTDPIPQGGNMTPETSDQNKLIIVGEHGQTRVHTVRSLAEVERDRETLQTQLTTRAEEAVGRSVSWYQATEELTHDRDAALAAIPDEHRASLTPLWDRENQRMQIRLLEATVAAHPGNQHARDQLDALRRAVGVEPGLIAQPENVLGSRLTFNEIQQAIIDEDADQPLLVRRQERYQVAQREGLLQGAHDALLTAVRQSITLEEIPRRLPTARDLETRTDYTAHPELVGVVQHAVASSTMEIEHAVLEVQARRRALTVAEQATYNRLDATIPLVHFWDHGVNVNTEVGQQVDLNETHRRLHEPALDPRSPEGVALRARMRGIIHDAQQPPAIAILPDNEIQARVLQVIRLSADPDDAIRNVQQLATQLTTEQAAVPAFQNRPDLARAYYYIVDGLATDLRDRLGRLQGNPAQQADLVVRNHIIDLNIPNPNVNAEIGTARIVAPPPAPVPPPAAVGINYIALKDAMKQAQIEAIQETSGTPEEAYAVFLATERINKMQLAEVGPGNLPPFWNTLSPIEKRMHNIRIQLNNVAYAKRNIGGLKGYAEMPDLSKIELHEVVLLDEEMPGFHSALVHYRAMFREPRNYTILRGGVPITIFQCHDNIEADRFKVLIEDKVFADLRPSVEAKYIALGWTPAQLTTNTDQIDAETRIMAEEAQQAAENLAYTYDLFEAWTPKWDTVNDRRNWDEGMTLLEGSFVNAGVMAEMYSLDNLIDKAFKGEKFGRAGEWATKRFKDNGITKDLLNDEDDRIKRQGGRGVIVQVVRATTKEEADTYWTYADGVLYVPDVMPIQLIGSNFEIAQAGGRPITYYLDHGLPVPWTNITRPDISTYYQGLVGKAAVLHAYNLSEIAFKSGYGADAWHEGIGKAMDKLKWLDDPDNEGEDRDKRVRRWAYYNTHGYILTENAPQLAGGYANKGANYDHIVNDTLYLGKGEVFWQWDGTGSMWLPQRNWKEPQQGLPKRAAKTAWKAFWWPGWFKKKE